MAVNASFFYTVPQATKIWRERGYREALAAHNIPFDPALIASGGFDDEEAFAAIQQILRRGSTSTRSLQAMMTRPRVSIAR